MPVFVRIEDPSEINTLVADLRTSINEAKEQLSKIDDLSKQEVEKVNEWRANFSETTEKISAVTNTLLEPERI